MDSSCSQWDARRERRVAKSDGKTCGLHTMPHSGGPPVLGGQIRRGALYGPGFDASPTRHACVQACQEGSRMTLVAPEFDWLCQLIKADGACCSHGGRAQGQVSCGQAPSYWKE